MPYAKAWTHAYTLRLTYSYHPLMQLISPEEVLGIAFVPDDSIKPENIRLARIEIAQIRYIRPAFGQEMYRNMILEKYNSFVSGYIKPALAHFIRYELIGELVVRASDQGVLKPSVEEVDSNASATKNDLQNRTDSSKEEHNQLEVEEKTTTQNKLENTSKNITDKSTKQESKLHEQTVTETQNLTQNDRKTDQNTILEQLNTTSSESMTEESRVIQDDLSKDTTTNTSDSGETAVQSTQNDTSDTTLKVDASDESSVNSSAEQNHVISKDLSSETSLQSQNNSSSSTARKNLQAASSDEWKLLAKQALRDARMFLRYAIEHVEQNREDFPDYAPVAALGTDAPRRCIGGMIL